MAETAVVDLIVKLGGSGITNKKELEEAEYTNIESTAALAKQCVEAGLKVIFVHGAGYFLSMLYNTISATSRDQNVILWDLFAKIFFCYSLLFFDTLLMQKNGCIFFCQN